MSDNNSIHVIYKRPQNPSNYTVTLEEAMTAQGIVQGKKSQNGDIKIVYNK